MIKLSSWGLFELMLHQLIIELSNQDVAEVELQLLDDLYEKAIDPKNRDYTIRFLDRAIRIVCNQLGFRIVFLLDEFDDLYRIMSLSGFNALRAIRDEYKYHLMYVVATRLELKSLREDNSEVEAFEEIISPRTFWIGPYSEVDAHQMMRRLETRYGVTPTEDNKTELLVTTGGHPGLLRTGYLVACEHNANLRQVLLTLPKILDECQRIWLSLWLEERQVLINLVTNAQVIKPDKIVWLERLRQKGLIGGPWSGNDKVFSPIFADYIKKQDTTVDTGIYVDRKRQTLWINGYEIRGLSALEYDLIAYLDERRGQVCSRDELIQHLYPYEENYNVTDNRLDSVVKRLRKQVEPNSRKPKYIVTVHGRGFCLVDQSPEQTKI